MMMIMVIIIVIIERLRAFRRTDQLEEHTVVMTMMMIVIIIVATIERLRAFRRLPRCLIDWWA